MLKAILFDFDGVLVDTEPLHFQIFQQVLSEQGVTLSEQDYYSRYVGLDDVGCFQTILCEQGRPTDPDSIGRLVDRKARLFLARLKKDLVFYPGTVEFVNLVASTYRLAIVSGALRHEIEYSLEAAGVRKQFEHITAAQDIKSGKPAPDGYLHALHCLQQKAPLHVSECLVIEDTIAGIQAAHAAGMRCLAITNTYSATELALADAVIPSLKGYDLAALSQGLCN
jgi:beta-phosphoglucomutase